MLTPPCTPASTRVRRARNRWRGGAVPGSVRCQTSGSSVGTEKLMLSGTRVEAAAMMSASRTASGPRVMMLKRVRASARIWMQARVSLYRPSAGWYGSVAEPIATWALRRLGSRNSCRSTSAMFGFTRMEMP
jgi:hypothetical protein